MGLISFLCSSPAASWSPTVNPDYADGNGKTVRFHQPKAFCGANLYSYGHGSSKARRLGWTRLPGDDKIDLVTFFDTIGGNANTFVFTDTDSAVYTARMKNADALSMREVEPGYFEVQIDLELS